MRPMEGGQGPEALILGARLARHRALAVYRDLEMPRENSLYVEVCVQAQLRRGGGLARAAGRVGAWARLRTALGQLVRRELPRRDPERREPTILWAVATAAREPARSLSAAPVGRLEHLGPAQQYGGTAVSLAFQPLLAGECREGP